VANSLRIHIKSAVSGILDIPEALLDDNLHEKAFSPDESCSWLDLLRLIENDNHKVRKLGHE
jgi:hypothetical protein